VTGKTGGAAYPALVVTDPNTPHTAYLQSDAGFLTNSTATNAIQAPNGGVTAKDIAATDSVWNGLQNSSGGIAANAVYTKTNGTAPANPGAGYGGLDYQGGSTYWYWNAATPGWTTVDLSAVGTGNFWVAGSGGVIYYNGGKVGIGTASPIGALDLCTPGANTYLNLTPTSGSYGLYLGEDSATQAVTFYHGPNYGFVVNVLNAPLVLGANNAASVYVWPGGNVGIGMTNPAYKLQLAVDSAAKPATNTWTVPSDIRLKTDVRDYTDGLDKLRQVKPIRYRYNGKANMPKTEGVGLDAAAHKHLLPDCISTLEGEIDGEKTDIHHFNSHAITFLLINAVRELAERLEKLERE
jgi:hypothetical protein